MDIRIVCCALSLFLFNPQAIASEIKRWVDEDGRVHFGHTAPHGTESTITTPVIITTETASNSTLKDILRPGERRMLRRHEQRGRRLIKGKRISQKKARQRERQIAKMEDKCEYHKQKKDALEQKLRNGYKPSKKGAITRGIDRHRRHIRRYCNYR